MTEYGEHLRRGLLAALGMATVLGACSNAQPPEMAPPVPQVSVVTVRRASVPVTIELPGRTSPYLVAQVRARVDGIVQKRDYREGTDVRAGQRLYQIDPAPYVASLNSAKATLQKAEANVVATRAQAERFGTLVAGNAVSKQDYDNALSTQRQAEADVASGKASVDTASINLGYTSVLSPINGRAGISLVTEGAYVQASQATIMTTIQQIDPIYVDVTQSSVEGLRLRRDVANGRIRLTGPHQARVTLILEDGTTYPLTGSLTATDVTVDPTTGTVTLRALFRNPQSVLLPGMFVRARVEEGVTENMFLVPQAGVTHDSSGKATALVVGPDNKVELRTLQVRGTYASRWIVEGGLAEGDQIIVSGLQKAEAGAIVQAAEAATIPDSPGVPADVPAAIPASGTSKVDHGSAGSRRPAARPPRAVATGLQAKRE
jgi:membrane fusion protein (multidrug efflux system)